MSKSFFIVTIIMMVVLLLACDDSPSAMDDATDGDQPIYQHPDKNDGDLPPADGDLDRAGDDKPPVDGDEVKPADGDDDSDMEAMAETEEILDGDLDRDTVSELEGEEETPPVDGDPDDSESPELEVEEEVSFESWSFAALADPRENGFEWRNALGEIRRNTQNSTHSFSPAEFIVTAGDVDPNLLRYTDYKNAFAGDLFMRGYFPAVGNHDSDSALETGYIQNFILPEQSNITRRDVGDVNYHVDWNNIRLIVVDAYSALGQNGCINSTGLHWVEDLIISASWADHVFITFHEPAFPRNGHTGDSFNACLADRNAFWDMLMLHKDIVRAVFVGHTHTYSRMRVSDPRSLQANNPLAYPDDAGGIYQIDCGAAGNGDVNVQVRVEVERCNVYFKTLQADQGWFSSFSPIDEWEFHCDE